MPALPPYRLQTLLEVRERHKEACQRQLSAALSALKLAQERLREMERELERMVADREERRCAYLEKAMKGEIAALDAINTNKYNERLKQREQVQKDAIVGQHALVAQRQEDVAAARRALVLADQELKALEKHKKRWTDEIKRARQVREEDDMDELAQTIYTRGQGGNDGRGG